MVQLKGSVVISFGGIQEPAAYGELVSIGGLGSDTNKKLSATIAATMERKVNVPKSHFYIKFYDVKVGSQFLSFFCLCENGFPIEPSSAPVVLIFGICFALSVVAREWGQAHSFTENVQCLHGLH